jgi:hypothetical protein
MFSPNPERIFFCFNVKFVFFDFITTDISVQKYVYLLRYHILQKVIRKIDGIKCNIYRFAFQKF